MTNLLHINGGECLLIFKSKLIKLDFFMNGIVVANNYAELSLSDKDQVLNLLQENGRALEFATQQLRADKELV